MPCLCRPRCEPGPGLDRGEAQSPGAPGPLLGTWPAAPAGPRRARQDRFDHWEHRALFPDLPRVPRRGGGFHAGRSGPAIRLRGLSRRDHREDRGVGVRRPRPGQQSSIHPPEPCRGVTRARGADSTLRCSACHSESGADPMRVRPPIVQNCLDCHCDPDRASRGARFGLRHLPRAAGASGPAHPGAGGRFPAPPSHRAPGLPRAGHGKQARAKGAPIAASCATCHARDYCTECHVNAPEVPAIQALGPGSPVPRAHGGARGAAEPRGPRFLCRHGGQARKEAAEVRHVPHAGELPRLPRRLSCQCAWHPRGRARPGPRRAGRAGAARLTRLDFSDSHAEPASARPQSCGACHARDPVSGLPPARRGGPRRRATIPPGFLTTHPAAAYTARASCADCHNQAQFCANCHLNAGLGSPGRLARPGYHDAKQSFLLNHGQAARQNLESCVSCHSERDCLTCHSAMGGRRFNPHGPGFDPETLRRKNPSMCTACHGTCHPG